MYNISRLASILAVAMAGLGSQAARGQALQTYNVASDRVYVAGISSGAFMAVQMHVAYSRTFHGAAIYAGGPDDCAQDSLANALTTCIANVPPVDAETLTSVVRGWAEQGLIDPLGNLKGSPVYLWSGLLDTNVRQPLVDALKTQYESLGASVFHYDHSYLAAHGWESPYGPNLCPQAGSPYLVTCSKADNTQSGASGPSESQPYDSEQIWLTRWLGPLMPKNNGILKGSLLSFNQNEFAPGGSAAALSMDSMGYVYVPQDCATGTKCALVLVLHGCQQSYSAVGLTFINNSGVNQWADTNHTIVLYPQAVATNATGSNAQGCWNWWGYLNDPDYAVKSGPQMQTLFHMVERVTHNDQ